MINEEAKEQAIKKAYGSQYTELMPDSLGRIDFFSFRKNKDISLNLVQLDADGKYWRPKSLSGIENNNGWTRIEPDGSNTPDLSSKKYKAGILENGVFKEVCSIATDLMILDYHDIGKITHYKPIEQEPLPIY